MDAPTIHPHAIGPHVADALDFLEARGLRVPDRTDAYVVGADARDLALIDLADSLENVVALAHSLDADVARYRLVAQAAFDALGQLHRQLERVTADRFRLADENRRLREELFIRADAA